MKKKATFEQLGRPFCSKKAIGRGKRLIHRILYVSGLTFMIGNSILMFLTFIVAYLNNYKVTVYINQYVEAHIEMALMLISLPCIGYAIWKKLE